MKDRKKFQVKPFVQMTPNEINISQRPIQKAELNHYYEQEASDKDCSDEEYADEECSDNENSDQESEEQSSPPKKNLVFQEEEIKTPEKHHSDKIKCEYCGEIYTRSNITAHRKTKYHQAYVTMNDKIRKLLLNKFDEDDDNEIN